MRKSKNCEGDKLKTRSGIYFSMVILLAVKVLVIAFLLSGCSEDVIDMSMTNDAFSLAGLEENFPASFAESVEINPVVGVTFLQGTNDSKIAASSLTLKKGTTPVEGNIIVSGNTMMFAYGKDLAPMTNYTATLSTSRKNSSGEDEDCEYSWTFKTGKDRKNNSLNVVSVEPPNLATNVSVTTSLVITVDQDLKSWMKNMISVVMKAGSATVDGSLSFAGKTITFDPFVNLNPGVTYSCSFVFGNTTGNNGGNDDGDDDDDEDDDKSANPYNWSFTTSGVGGGTNTDNTPPTVSSVNPASGASSVPVGTTVSVTFSEPMNSSTITSANFNLKQGSTVVPGSITYSGNVATFTPSANLAGSTSYTGTVTTGVKDAAGNALASVYSWNFTTAAPVINDVTPPTVQSVSPASGATSVAVNSKVTATFSEQMNSSTINTTTFNLKQGNTVVQGTVTYSGNVATFTPSANLAGSTGYTATITTGVKDAAGNALSSTYSWNFTTAAPVVTDVTPPTVQTVSPSAGATSVAINSSVTATFSEQLNSSTVNTTTFNLKQGNTVIQGTVTYSGNVATFTPSANLAGNTVYSATVTTGVKDVAGNSMAANYTWTFTTVAVSTGMSFATDVVPVLGLCNNCHKHPWTTSTVASTYYTNLVNEGYVNPTSPLSSLMYTKLNGGHASSIADRTKILTWFKEGAKNN